MYSDGAITPLTDASLPHSSADINDAGRIVWDEFDATVNRIVCLENGMTSVLVEQMGVCCPRINDQGDMVHGWYNPETDLTETIVRTSDGTVFLLPGLGLACTGAEINDRIEVVWRGVDINTIESGILLLRRAAPNGDFNHDCHIDGYDYAILEKCFTGDGLGPAGGLLADCARADFDGDGDVDQPDVSSFLATATGPGVAVSGCEP
jgi:hypothetical protein